MTDAASFDWSVWGPPLVVLLLGLVAGLLVALRSRTGGIQVAEGERAALLARKQMLVEQVRAMEADRDKLDEAEFAARRDALVSEAALVLKSLEELDAATDAIAGATPAPPPDTRRTGLFAAYAVGAVLLFAVLGAGLTEFSKPRQQGGSMTGGGPSEGGGGGPVAALSAEVEAANKTLETDPENLDALNVVSYDHLLKGDLNAAMATIDKARAIAPEDPSVLTHLAMLQLAIGMGDRAIAGLEQAIAARPDWGRPHLWMGLARMQSSDKQLAEKELNEALSLGLNQIERQFAMQLLAEARAPAAAAGPMAGGPAGGGAAAAAAPSGPPSAADLRLGGHLSFASGVTPAADQVVFVIVHRNAAGSGPPVAAKRLPASALPTDFWFTDSDVMMGGPWPDEVFLFARLDADGRAGSSEGDVESETLGPLAKGSVEVALTVGQ